MFYYDLIRFLHERLRSNSSASTYVYYYTNPPIFDLDNVLRRIPDMIGHFAELDLTWGIPYFSRTARTNIAYSMNISYKPEEFELSLQLIRYWTNFAKTGTCFSFVNKILILNKHVSFQEAQMNQNMYQSIGHCMNIQKNPISILMYTILK